MKPRNYSTEAIILAVKDYSEADRILVVFSKDYGKLSLIAKGVRKTNSKKRGHLEVFNLIKFSATKTKGLDIIVEAEIIKSYSKIRKDLKKVSLGYYFCEVLGKSTKEEEVHRQTFDLLEAYFTKLEKQKMLKNLRINFVSDLLVNLGYWPKDKKIIDVDRVLEEVIERQINSYRVGKKILE